MLVQYYVHIWKSIHNVLNLTLTQCFFQGLFIFEPFISPTVTVWHSPIKREDASEPVTGQLSPLVRLKRDHVGPKGEEVGGSETWQVRA